MNRRKEIIYIVMMISICCGIMAVVDGIIQPDYAVKSGVKIVLFLLCPFTFAFFDKDVDLKSIFKWDKKNMKLTILLAIAVYLVIVLGYFLTKGIFDFSGVTESLTNNIGVTGKRFIWVALYISFINSLLEEFFFRGFAFLTIKRLTNRRFAYIFSSLAFAVYHVAMMVGWFSIWVYLITMLGLVMGAMIFNYLNEKSGTIYNSWMVHMSANFAINTIGFILFGII